jgi:hypothetical protein
MKRAHVPRIGRSTLALARKVKFAMAPFGVVFFTRAMERRSFMRIKLLRSTRVGNPQELLELFQIESLVAEGCRRASAAGLKLHTM